MARGARLHRSPAGRRDRRRGCYLPHPGPGRHGRRRRRGDQLQLRVHGFRPGVADRGDRHVHAGLRDLRGDRPPGRARLGADGHRLGRVRDHHHRRPRDRRGHQPGPLPGHRVHAGRVRRHRFLGSGARLPHRRDRGRRARRPRLGLHRPGAPRRRDDQPGPRRRRTGTSKWSSVMKKLINSAETVVTEALEGVAAAHPSLSVDVENKVIVRAGRPTPGKVGLVSGGGSGHEPLHGGAGVLHVVKNYTGDVLNFQMAAEMAGDEGIEVVPVVINDDVAVEDSLYTAGRRGTGATVFVEKIAGALAEQGAGLAAVAAVAREVNERSRSFGVALSSCVVPAAGKPTFELGEAEAELGIGIHGEPGRTRAALAPASELAAVALDAIRADLPVGGDLLVMVNGMGGTPLIELYLMFNEVRKYLEGHGGHVVRNLVGSYITSLEMQGFSVTVCQLTDTLTRLWDAPVDTPALRWGR